MSANKGYSLHREVPFLILICMEPAGSGGLETAEKRKKETHYANSMETFILEKENGRQTACVKEIPASLRGIVIAIHGFTSSKESPTVQLLLQRLPAVGLGVIGIDLPAHGNSVSREEELRIEACMDSLQAAEEYASAHCGGKEIFYFASSFGAYITSLYISQRPHKGRSAFFRSAAVNMPDLFAIDRDHLSDAERKMLKELDEKGYIQPSLDLGSPVKVTAAMLQDLAENNLFEKFDPDRYGRHRIAMAHGEEDNVIDPKAARRFAQEFHIPITFYKGEGHSLSILPGTAEAVVRQASQWFLQQDE